MADEANTEQEVKPAEVIEDSKETSEAAGQPAEDLEIKVKQLESDKVGLVEQLKDLRTKLQEERLSHAVGATKVEGEVPQGDEVETKVLSILQKEKQKELETTKTVALKKFLVKHPEFRSDNDPTGLRNEALVDSLKRLNTSKSFTENQILEDYETALRLISESDSKTTLSDTSSEASTTTVPVSPQPAPTRLTPEQESLRREKGWTVEKYLKMKAKYPRIIL